MSSTPFLRSPDPNLDTNRWRIRRERRKRIQRQWLIWGSVVISLAALSYTGAMLWQNLMGRH